MEINEVKEMTIADFFKMCEKEQGEYQIDTPDGWQNINFLIKKKNKECYNLITESGNELGCSAEHQILTKDGWEKSQDIDVQNDLIITRNGTEQIVAKEYIGRRDTFDLQVNSNENRYYSNDIVSHNCGKSLVCKAVASAWGMPLLRLDFGALFASHVGESEERSRMAIHLAEVISPTVLFIDEIEKAISGVQSSGRTDGGTTSRVLSTFLTWMQDKTAPVFVVATANDHSSIPPEFLRAGRFDEIFFVDLPRYLERKKIFSIHLEKRSRNPKSFNLNFLAEITESFTGAEIESSIEAALYEAFSDKKREVTNKDIETAIKNCVPISKLMKEDIENLRLWASDRARNASNYDDIVLLDEGDDL